MASEQQERIKLPAWLDEVLEGGDPTDTLPIKRTETRRTWVGSCFAHPADGTSGDRILIRGLNTCPGGLGCVSRRRLAEGQHFKITPMDGKGEPVHVRVIHCTQTVQGYKVGFAFEQE